MTLQHIFLGNCNYSDPEFCSNSTQGSICVWTDGQTCVAKEDLRTVSTNRTCSSTVTGNIKSDEMNITFSTLYKRGRKLTPPKKKRCFWIWVDSFNQCFICVL